MRNLAELIRDDEAEVASLKQQSDVHQERAHTHTHTHTHTAHAATRTDAPVKLSLLVLVSAGRVLEGVHTRL